MLDLGILQIRSGLRELSKINTFLRTMSTPKLNKSIFHRYTLPFVCAMEDKRFLFAAFLAILVSLVSILGCMRLVRLEVDYNSIITGIL